MPERGEGVPASSLLAQERVDHPEQESEQCGGVVDFSYRMAISWTVLPMMRCVPYRRVLEEGGVL